MKFNDPAPVGRGACLMVEQREGRAVKAWGKKTRFAALPAGGLLPKTAVSTWSLQEKHQPMGSASTASIPTVALLLLLGCGACSSYRSSTRQWDLPPVFQQDTIPIASDTGIGVPWNGRATAAMAKYPCRVSHRRYGVDQATRRPSRLWSKCQEGKCKLRTDHQNYYSWLSMRDLLLGVAAGSVLANTSLDQDFQDWYQDDVRSSGTDDFASFWRAFGEGYIFIPAFACLGLAGAMCDQTGLGSVTADFGCQTTRAYLVGGPPVLFMQCFLGGSRPGESSYQSRWKPLDDNNAVSGHAFVGAVPFITAAKMADDPFLKGGLYLCSTLTAWSRVNDDRHYLSQVCLGWWMAYLACNAVDKTEYEYEHLTFTPVTTPEMVGLGVIYER